MEHRQAQYIQNGDVVSCHLFLAIVSRRGVYFIIRFGPAAVVKNVKE